jgi:hypothetical protein
LRTSRTHNPLLKRVPRSASCSATVSFPTNSTAIHGDLADRELLERTIKELVVARGSKGGSHTRDAYGADYFSWLSQRRKIKRGWPKGKLRKNTPTVQAQQTIDKLDLNPAAKQMFKAMLSVCTQKGGK